jgi:hypothetical protein
LRARARSNKPGKSSRCPASTQRLFEFRFMTCR